MQSRYYDPLLGRFISPDSIDYLEPHNFTGMNLYAYCGNNPVMYSDPSGHSVIAIIAILATTTIAGGIIGGAISHNHGNEDGELVKDIVLGAFMGLATGGAIVATAAVFAGAFGALAGTTATATAFGIAVPKAFAIGALAFDIVAFGVTPLFGFSMQGIEWQTPEKPQLSKPEITLPHPAMNPKPLYK